MNDQRRLLVWQAHDISLKIKKLNSKYEYLILARAFDGINHPELAEKYYKLSMTAEEMSERGIAIRAYASFLFYDGRLEEARENYSSSIDCFNGGGDRLVSYRFDTYLRWAEHENLWRNRSKELELLEIAKLELKQIENPVRKENEMKRIDSLMVKPKEPVAEENLIEKI